MSRVFKTDEDCADCLCRVCARNILNDSVNKLSEPRYCLCDCNIGTGEVIETEADCPEFLPDEGEE